ncbi:MAG TPA: diacylglycerol kinase family protein [Anaerolineaceae bacterium]|nr:diacylglycerol kinase family protein [Anaerolineaceae bacterium]
MYKNKSFTESMTYAISGIARLLKNERNARFHLAATIIVILVSAFIKISIQEWALIIFAIFFVWIAEAFNTALEQLFDLVEPGKNGLVKAGKDISAGAVLFAAVLSVIIGLLILGPPILRLIFPKF